MSLLPAHILPFTCSPAVVGKKVAATFDRDLARAWGDAMGEEFRGKGSNVQLGPGMNVARVPTNGRNFEYASGEVRRYISASLTKQLQ